jgi:hypothetical protein
MAINAWMSWPDVKIADAVETELLLAFEEKPVIGSGRRRVLASQDPATEAIRLVAEVRAFGFSSGPRVAGCLPAGTTSEEETWKRCRCRPRGSRGR